jgi:hypothetical protein
MMSRTIYLSRLIGLFILVATLSMLVDKAKAVETIGLVVQDRALLTVLGLIGAGVGLALVLGHQVWSGGALPIVVTVLGWVFRIRGAAWLFLSADATSRLVDWVRFADLFHVYMGCTTALGLYLTVQGFFRLEPGASSYA